MEDCLQLFESETAYWFKETLGEPTPVQKEAWSAIAAGGHVLVSAPTGAGKTLSAFLVFLDRFKKMALDGLLKQELQLIYVSPLKSLASDIRENLRKPLAGIGGKELVRVAIRTGDTTQQERRQMIRKPPHILIITPESLYLMLTSKTGQNMLCTAGAVIIDELHALIDTKRGAHLMLSLARLDVLCERPLQRIGLSATISPLEEAACYLAPEEVRVVAPSMEKKVMLEILGSYVDSSKRKKDPVWQELSKLVYRYCQGNRSVIAFVEGRRYAEKLAYYVNLIGGEDFARVHHGSLSKEQRREAEEALRGGKLRLLCATSSMELGIDVGEIDQVLQVGCPRTISGTLQRLGRAGHNPDRTSVMYLFPRTPAECILSGMTAQLAREGEVERMNPPKGCLDVLAQHLVSMAAFQSYEVDEVMKILPRAWSFSQVTREDVKAVLRMLAGDYEHKREVPVRPRILYDRIHDKVEGDGYSRMLAISAGGTIPDKGLYTVRTQEGVKVGEADEEFVYESQKGDRFILGAFGWKVVDIGRDTVTVTQAPVEGARLPFWKGELKGRSKETGILFGRILRGLADAQRDGKLIDALAGLGLDESAARLSEGYLSRQIAATGGLPDDRTILAEHFRDQSGNSQLMIHSIFGRRINAPLSLLAAKAAQVEIGMNVGSVDEEDGFLLYAYGDKALPEGLLGRINPETAKPVLSALLPSAPVFNMAFRYNCGRALMMGAKGNQRQPLWMQRLRSAEMLDQVAGEKEHPLIRETRRECMEQLWDAEGVKELLYKIRSGEVVVREIYSQNPSPMSLPLQWSQEAAVMYDYAPTPRGIHKAVEEALKQEEQLIKPGEEEILQVQARKKLPVDEKQLHSLLMAEGDLAAGELEVPIEWLENLHREDRAVYLEQGLWIAAEQREEYQAALEEGERKEQCRIVRRMLRYRGGASAGQTALRYGWSKEIAKSVLEELCSENEAVRQIIPAGANELGDGEKVLYYHAQLYKRARNQTLKNRREEIKTCAPWAYAALLASGLTHSAPKEESLKRAIDSFLGIPFPASAWEEILLPGRVRDYRENLLDGVLSKGEIFWHMEEGGRLRFDGTDQIDWDSAPQIEWEKLSEKEKLLTEALVKRGASFMQALGGVLEGESPYDTLLSLMEKGIVCADSFVPVRQWLDREKIRKSTARVRAGARVKALSAGRWDLVRPIRLLTLQEQMDRCFDRYKVLCRETAAACGFSWQEALKSLRILEYTGQVRRGYFVEGLSGAQFIRGTDFGGITAALRNAGEEIVWMNGADPMQVWGKLLPSQMDRAFLNVQGSAVALRGGMPVAVFERNGGILRVFEEEFLEEVLERFVEGYRRGQIFTGKKRILVKEYPDISVKSMEKSGFAREVQGYGLYR
ncbi:MAG: DEAD/DEAH box helicase [Lachnospiraceae bacterium]|nr:DEAD/DEAH box helicase [Lachnospiraceae bacterium]